MLQRDGYSWASLALLLVLLVVGVLLSNQLLSGWRVDLTDNRLYTLSDGSRSIAREMPEPVTLELFFSEAASRELPQVRSYARWVEEMLEEFASHSDGQLTVRRVDPEPFSPAEDRAAAAGLQAVPVGAAGDSLYLGIVATNSLDDVQVMPFLQPNQQAFLEYDVAKMVWTLSHPERRRVGLLTTLDMQGGMDPTTGTATEPWVIVQQLQQLFEVAPVATTAGALPDDLDLLVMVHPRGLSEDLLYAVDQFVLGGGRLLVFLDPLAEMETSDAADPLAALSAAGPSNLGPLLDSWGVTFDPSRVVGDLVNALSVSQAPGQPPVRHVGIIRAPRESMNGDDVVTAELETINLSTTGWLAPLEGASTTFEPLVQTSENAMPLDAAQMRFLSDPGQLLDGFRATGDRYALAARVTGPVSSAFPGHEADGHLETSNGDINVVLAGDSDLLSDRLWVQKQGFLGQVLTTAFADNGNFAVNAVDNLLGSSELISIRTRAELTRPFDRVEALRLDAETRFRETEQSLQQELEDTERRLTEIRSRSAGDDLTVLNPEQQAEIDRFLEQRTRIRSELRQVRHDLQKDIDQLGQRLRLLNIVMVPLVVAALGLWVARRRRRRIGWQTPA